MKKTLLFTLVFATNLAFSQEFSFTMGPDVPEDKEGFTNFFNPSLQKGYSIRTGRKNSIEVVSLEGYLKPGETKEIKSEIITMDDVTLHRWVASNGKNYLIYSTVDKKRDEITVYLQELSADMLLLGSPIKIATFRDVKGDEKIIRNISGPGISKGVNVFLSEDNKLVMMVRERKGLIEMASVSLESGPLWTKSITLDPKREYDLTHCLVGDNGNVYLLGAQWDHVGDFGDPVIVAYDPTAKKEKISSLLYADDKVGRFGYTIKFLNDQIPYLMGVTSTPIPEKRKEYQSGYDVLKINTNTLALEKYASSIINEEFSRLMRRGNYNPSQYSVVEAVQLTNGKIVFSIESTFGVTFSAGTSYFSTPAYVVSVDNNGASLWNTIIQKDQIDGYNRFVGHYLFTKSNKVYMLYNDHIDNIDLAPTDEPNEKGLKTKMYICVTEIDETGKSKKLKPVTSDKKQYSVVKMYTVKKVNGNMYHCALKVGDQTRFATFSMD